MEAFQVATTHLFDAILFPFRSFHPMVALGALSLLTGVLMLIAFRYTSNQAELRRIKEKAKAHILEIKLFKHDPRLVIAAQRRILRYSIVHLRYAVIPFLVMLPLLIIIVVQLHLRFGYRPLQAGESAIVTVKLADQVPWRRTTIDLSVPDGVEIETPALRVEEDREVSWRVKAHQLGKFDLTFRLPEQEVQKSLIVAKGLAMVSPRRARSTSIDFFLSPGEGPLPSDFPIQSIVIGYPAQDFRVWGWSWHWLVIFCVLSLAGGYALKGVFKVEL